MRLISFACLFVVSLNLVSYAQESVHYEDAYSAYEAGKLDETYIFLKNSLRDNPNHLPSKMLMGEVLALSGYFEDSSKEFAESIAEGADLNLVLESYVRVLLVLRDHGSIIDLPESQLTPAKKGFLRSAQAASYAAKQDFENADKFHKKAYEIAPTNINVLNSAARYYMSSNKYELAKARIDESLAVNNEVSTTYELLARYYSFTKNKEKQIEALHKGLTIAETHPIILRELVSAYAEVGEYNKAKDIINTTLETSPNDPMASLLLSWIAAQLGENELSSETLTSLVNQLSAIDGDELAQSDYMLFVSALANYAANNFEIARSQLEQYVNRNPKKFEASKLLADIYEKERIYTSAIATLERFPEFIDADITLISKLCGIYIKARLNHKCNSLLLRNRAQYGRTAGYIQTEANLLAARGKLDLALENLNKIDSEALSILAQKAVIAIQDNKLDIANEAVSKLLEASPNSSDFLNLQASIFKKQGNFERAEEIYRLALGQSPKHFAANFNLTHIYYLTNRLNIAKANVLNLMEMRVNNIDVLLLHANILISLKDYEGALESISTAEALTRNDAKVEDVYIRLYVATNEYKKALFRVNNLLKDDLTNVLLLMRRAELNYKLENIEEAHKDLRIIFGLVANEAQSLFELSIIQKQFLDIDGAYKSIKQAHALNPENLYINRNLADLALIKKEFSLAAEKISWLVKNAPQNPDVLLLQGDLALSQKDNNKAAIHYLNAVRLNGKLSPALVGAYILAQKGIQQEAFKNTFYKLALEPETNTFSTHLYADYLFAQNDLEEAKNAYVSISGQNSYKFLPAVLNNLANIYIKEDKIDVAHNFAQQAYEIQQKNPAVLDTLGWITALRGNYDQALSFLRQAYSMNAQDPNLRYHLAYVLHKLGRNSESSRELKIVLSDFDEFEKRELAIALQAQLKQ